MRAWCIQGVENIKDNNTKINRVQSLNKNMGVAKLLCQLRYYRIRHILFGGDENTTTHKPPRTNNFVLCVVLCSYLIQHRRWFWAL